MTKKTGPTILEVPCRPAPITISPATTKIGVLFGSRNLCLDLGTILGKYETHRAFVASAHSRL
jgi:hypothetical protein